ncbi:MAG TPA: hypothetical protein VGD59_12590 [Acidisarcina sp.]
MRGRVIDRPEDLAGLWEASDSAKGAVGLLININAHVAGNPSTLQGIPEYEDSFSVAVYQRKGPQFDMWSSNWFSDDPTGGLFWDGTHLRIQWTDTTAAPPVGGTLDDAIEVDLTYDRARGAWSGLFHRKDFNRQVRLRRPSFSPEGRRHAGTTLEGSPMVGTWVTTEPIGAKCLHLVQQADGALNAWVDTLQTPGLLRWANGRKPPQNTWEHYGELVRVQQLATSTISAEVGAYGGICCASTVVAKISADGRTLSGNWLPGLNQLGRPAEWKRIVGSSCRVFSPPPPQARPCSPQK